MSKPSIIDVACDPQMLNLKLSPAQEVVLRSIYGESLTKAQKELWRQLTGRDIYPQRPFSEATVIAGARSGKGSRLAAPIAIYETYFSGAEKYLARGETGVFSIVAQTQQAAGISYGYIRDSILGSKLLASKLNADPLKNEISIGNLKIRTQPCTMRSARGSSILGYCLDEAAFFKAEGGADSDVEIQASLRRGGLCFPNPKAIVISTPFAKSGLLWDSFRTLWGTDHPHAVCYRGPTALFNPTITEERLARERLLDPSRFAREYLAEFSEDTDSFLPAAWVEAAIQTGVHERPARAGVTYYAAVDPSGGGRDAFTLSIVHVEHEGSDRKVVQDVLKGWRGSRSETADLERIVSEASAVLKAYSVKTVAQDDYAAGWVSQAWGRHGIKVQSAGERSTNYLACEPLFAQGKLQLLDNPSLASELRLLMKTLLPGGKTKIDHPRTGGSGCVFHDDHADSAAKSIARAWAMTEPRKKRVNTAPLQVNVCARPFIGDGAAYSSRSPWGGLRDDDF